jgi:hypothetical protein
MIEDRNLSTFSYAELNDFPGLKESIYQEVKSQLIQILYAFADRRLGIDNMSDIKDHVYDRQRVTTQFFLALSQFNREYPDLDKLYFTVPRNIFLALDLRLEQAATKLKETENLDLFPDKQLREDLEEYISQIQQKVKFIHFRNRAKEILKDLKLDLFTVNLISQYMFEKQDASWDIRELESFYDNEYGYEVARLLAEIFLRFIQLFDLQSERNTSLDERTKVENELYAEIDERIFVYLPHEREELFDRIRRIIRMGYTLTELNKKIRSGKQTLIDAALADLKEVISKKDYTILIDGFLFEDIFTSAMDGVPQFASRMDLLRLIITGFLKGYYDVRVYAQALVYYYSPSKSNNNHSYYRMLGAACLKSDEYMKLFLELLTGFRDILNKAWKDPKYYLPFPVLLYTWRLFELMLKFMLNNLQERTDVTQVCESSFNQIFIYNITRRPVSVDFSKPRKESFEKMISTKYSTNDIYIPRSSVEKYCPTLLHTHFEQDEGLFLKLKGFVNYRENEALKKLVLYHREDLTQWLQRTRLQKLSSNHILKQTHSEELAELEEFQSDLDAQLDALLGVDKERK